jgi:hypothetical protein
MPISWKLESPHLVVCRVSGELTYEDFVRLNEGGEKPADGRKGHVLLFLEDFEGWKSSESWGELEFLERNDEMLDRIAIVGDERWREQMELFMLKGLRPVDIRYFTPEEEALARAWVGED